MMGESWPRKLHRTVDLLDRHLGPTLRRWPPLGRAWIGVLDGVVACQSDRRYMRNEIFPAIAQGDPARVLFVGVRGYTKSYGQAFAGRPTEFWTSDIDPEAARHGSPGRHVTEDVRQLKVAFPAAFFDVVIMNGVFGWGVDDPAGMDRALIATEHVLRSGGILLLGWNTDRASDPEALPSIGLFEAASLAGLPPRKSFSDVTHVYAWYRKLR